MARTRPRGSARAFLGGVVLLSILVSACTTLPPELVRPSRASLLAFDLEGRISVQQAGRPYHAGIEWHHTTDRDDIFLTGPLGQGLAELGRDTEGAYLRTADGKTHQASDWNSLARSVLDLPLPLNEMPRWLLADVEGGSRDAQGRPRRTLQAGWIIDYVQYESGAANALPTLLELQHDDIEVKLKVREWRLP
ncbi:MAG: outer membrane lipoprotein LolB [Proteobacteria bacterium]|nr:outer membrane lipoprotein LolB [Pseudomonadota bacterium]HQR03885.1 lipoprotein insertase outer membrane protein LolB [Rhodocyclaceae bacterium]